MKNRNSNNNKFHHRNYNLLLQTYNSFFWCKLCFCAAQLELNWCWTLFGCISARCASGGPTNRQTISKQTRLSPGPCGQHVFLRADLATPLSAHG